MAYLTLEEYTDLGFDQISPEEFEKLLQRASIVVDIVTGHFYQFNDIEDDVPFRRNQFKKAVAAQIEYFHEMGAVNTHGLAEPTTVTIGRTSIGSSRSPEAQNSSKNILICPEVYLYLQNTGLLFNGIGVR